MMLGICQGYCGCRFGKDAYFAIMGSGDATRIEAIKNGVRVTVWDWETVRKSIALQTVAKLRELRLH